MDSVRQLTCSIVAAGNLDVDNTRCTDDIDISPVGVVSIWSSSERYRAGGSAIISALNPEMG
jgi:hypothetical protein